ncbi:MAG: serine/threonine protein kinase [Deltaproteobacteria bacterium]|nr:serine/threonine protein kinase [Deltaproteobacteria bacterium]
MERAVLQTEADRYVILRRLAEGGMGKVYLGKKVGLQGFEKEVVLKQLMPEFTSQPQLIDLFLREARLSATLDHANIVHTLDLVAAGSNYYIVMEYVRGGDVRTILKRIRRRQRELNASAAIFIARETLAALAYAHSKKGANGEHLGLIHRDVSPSNIMISGAGEVKLTDFGIAKASTHKSVFYRVKGKVGYMSPEQAYADRPLDARSDLYSVAVILHEMITGERLFVGDLLSAPSQIYNQPIPRLEGRKTVPPGLDALLDVGLAFNRDRRYATANDFIDALNQLAFQTGSLYTAPDLAAHLRAVCGEDPSLWNQEVGEEHQPAGTEVLPGDRAIQQDDREDDEEDEFSEVGLTSIINPNTTVTVASSLVADFDVIRHAPTSAASPRSRRSPDSDLDEADTAFDEPTESSIDEDAPTRIHSADDALLRGDDAPTRIAPLDPADFEDQTRREPRGVVHRAEQGGPHRAGPLSAPANLGTDRLQRRRSDPLRTTQSLDRRQRNAMLIAAAALTISAIAIVITVGLSQPSEGGSTGAKSGKQATAQHALLREPTRVMTSKAAHAAKRNGSTHTAYAGLTINSSPAQASVFLDGKKQCNTPCELKGLRRKHVYLLSLEHQGHERWSKLFTLPTAPGTAKISAYLTAAKPPAKSHGYLEIRSTPAADIAINGVSIDKVTGADPIALPTGSHAIRLSHPQRKKTITFEVEITDGQTVRRVVRF